MDERRGGPLGGGEGGTEGMRLGIVIGVNEDAGGIFQYTEAVLKALDGWVDGPPVVVVCLGPPAIDRDILEGQSAREILEAPPSLLTRPEEIQPHLVPWNLDIKRRGINSRAMEWFSERGLDLLFFPSPSTLSFECGIPYVSAVHDLQHRIHPEFPEVSSMGQWSAREYLLRNLIRFAEAVFVDSEVGKEDVLIHYGQVVDPERIHPLPFSPLWETCREEIPEDLKAGLSRKYAIPERFIFCPAQFWSHKNHARLIHAVHLLRAREDLDVPLVLVGSKQGGQDAEARDLVFQNAMRLAGQLGVTDLIHYLGYLPQDEMPVLYAMARAMVLPTFFGPTNLPVVEAWAMGCPVVGSDIRGIREQIGDAGLLVDPTDASSIAQAVKRLWFEDQLFLLLSERGLRRLADFSFDRFRERLREILAGVIQRVEGKRERERGGPVASPSGPSMSRIRMKRSNERSLRGRILLIQENGRHPENRAFRECFCLKRAFAHLGVEAEIWGLGHGTFETPFEELDLSRYAAVLSLENYDTGWHPDLSRIRIPTLYWCIDAHVDISRHLEFVRRNRFDVVFCSTEPMVDRFKGVAGESIWLPNAYDHFLIDRRAGVQKRWDVGFCGNTLNRAEWIAHLKEKWNLRHDEMVLGEEMVRAINSYRIHWNRSISMDINYRVFETLGCGTFLLTNEVPSLERLFRVGEHLETYRDLKEMDEKIRFYLKNPERRQWISHTGYMHVRENHTYLNRARFILELLGLADEISSAEGLHPTEPADDSTYAGPPVPQERGC